MEHIKNTNNEDTCKNNYTSEIFMEAFGKDDAEMKKCNGCDNLTYDDGMMCCKKFSGGGDN